MSSDWCPVCCTRHSKGRDCPGDLQTTEFERHGFMVTVETPTGVESYGVLLAPVGDLWRARILTFPNILWAVPGGRGSMKFLGRTPQEAERQAIEYVNEHCNRRNYQRRDQLAVVESGPIEPAKAIPSLEPGLDSRRHVRSLRLQFGHVNPSRVGSSFNLSERGMFVSTPLPLDANSNVLIRLPIVGTPLSLEGEVRWSRTQGAPGRPMGMGVRLSSPPQRYVLFVRKLP